MHWKDIEVAQDWTHFWYRGEQAFGCRYRAVLKFHAPGLAPVKDDLGWHFINALGETVIAGPYLKAWGFYEGLCAVEDASGCHHIDAKGYDAYFQRYPWCGNFQDGCCVVRDDAGQYFHILPNGKPLSTGRYRYAGDFKDGFAAVKHDNGLYTHIDKEGATYYGSEFLDLGVYHKGYATAKDEGGWHHIDLWGKALYSHRFASLEPFYNDRAKGRSLDGKDVVVVKLGGGVEVIEV